MPGFLSRDHRKLKALIVLPYPSKKLQEASEAQMGQRYAQLLPLISIWHTMVKGAAVRENVTSRHTVRDSSCRCPHETGGQQGERGLGRITRASTSAAHKSEYRSREELNSRGAVRTPWIFMHLLVPRQSNYGGMHGLRIYS